MKFKKEAGFRAYVIILIRRKFNMHVDSVKDLVFGVIGGSALLMYGVELMGSSFEKAAGGFIKKTLSIFAGNLLSAFFTGIFITALVQSSTAVTVLTVGFVNAGLMNLNQAVGIIYGANIGTTITAQLMALDITEVSLPLIGIGYIIMISSNKNLFKNTGRGLMGLGMLLLGLRLINSGVPFLKSDPYIINFFRVYGNNTIISLIIGTLLTAAVQSSSAVMGVTMILARYDLISLGGAISLMIGSNIGTCAAAQLAAATGNTASKRAAWAHTLYNIIGGMVAIIAIKPFITLVQLLSPGMPIERQVANSHTLFNVLSAIVFLPVTKYYVRLIENIVPDRKNNR
ncbi:MAG: Na/Pi symporter [Clostridiales bacterium]|nr:Na/Pi symporter [Clostridiales bacterium]